MNIVFDLDSTLSTIEGIDELGALKNVRSEIEKLTNEAMSGKISFEDIFIKRLEIIKPTKREFEELGQLYLNNITPNAKAVIKKLKEDHKVFIVTGGYEMSTNLIARELGVDNYFANEIIFDNDGSYAGINETIPLWKDGGKNKVLKRIKEQYSDTTIIVGDGISDLEAGADKFIYFAGVVERSDVSARAASVIKDLNDIFNHLV